LLLKEEIISNRRHFHAHPELSFEETATAEHVADLLKSYGVENIQTGVAKTGVTGVIKGARPGPCIALRADMDALPINETNGLPYQSQNKDVMHACGHDGHMAILLGVTKILVGMRDAMAGSVKLLFQPAEERYGGASVMIEEGVLEDGKHGPKVDEVYGLHLWNYDKFGHVGVKDGPVMAFSDRFTVTVSGVGGHGATPHCTVDAVVVAANVVTALQTIASRNINPLEPVVVTCGTINGGYAGNVIADEVAIEGTVRTYSAETQAKVVERMESLLKGVGEAYGATVSLDYRYGYPATINSWPAGVRTVRAAAESVVGGELVGDPYPSLAAEDFSYFLNQRPGCFFFVGSSPRADVVLPHHKSVFTIHEDSLLVGASVMLNIVQSKLMP
jgi:amidohydrolase